MARRARWTEPVKPLSLGVAEVLQADRIVAVGRVSLSNDADGMIDFAVTSSVQPPPGEYVIRLASGEEHAVTLFGRAPAPRMRVRLGAP